MRASGVTAQPFCDACRRTGLTAPRVPSAMTSDSVKVRMVWRADGVASSLRIDRVRAAGGFPWPAAASRPGSAGSGYRRRRAGRVRPAVRGQTWGREPRSISGRCSQMSRER